jgi:hypothetical protein
MTINPDRYRATRETSFEDIDLDQETVIVGGRRYTEADAAAAARVEAQTRGLSRGGHSLSGDGAHSPKVATVLPRDVRDKVLRRADAEGISASEWVRRLIERKIA